MAAEHFVALEQIMVGSQGAGGTWDETSHPRVADSSYGARFLFLDALRGIGAAIVVQRHAPEFFSKALPSSYLAVDLFFIISGFVIAQAYESRLEQESMSFKEFLAARLVRLYPLYLLAVGLMFTYYALQSVLGSPLAPGELPVSLICGLFFLPTPFALSFNGALFLVHPAWSLFDELVCNLFYGAMSRRLSQKVIVAITLISGIVLVIAAMEFGRLHVGFRWNEMYGGLGRVFFSFFTGNLIHRYGGRPTVKRPWRAFICVAGLLIVLCMPVPQDFRAIHDLFAVFVVLPLIVYLGSSIKLEGAVASIASVLGASSYGVYVLHVPLLKWFLMTLPSSEFDGGMSLFKTAVGVAFIAVLIAMAWGLDKYFDRPLRRAVSSRL